MLVAIALACWVGSSFLFCPHLLPAFFEFPVYFFSIGAFVAEVVFAAVLIATLRLHIASRITATIAVALIIGLPMWAGYQLRLMWPPPGPMMADKVWTLISGIPLLIVAFGFVFHFLRIHRNLCLTTDREIESATYSKKHWLGGYAGLLFLLGIGMSIASVVWPLVSHGRTTWGDALIVFVACVAIGGLILLPTTYVLLGLPWFWSVSFFLGALVLSTICGLVMVPDFWGSNSLTLMSPRNLLLLIFPVIWTVMLVSFLLISLRLIGFRLVIQKYQLPPERPKPYTVHPLDR